MGEEGDREVSRRPAGVGGDLAAVAGAGAGRLGLRAGDPVVADMLDMPNIRVLEIATFYTMFHLEPVGSVAHIQVCGTTPCWLRGANDIKDVCRHRIHPSSITCLPTASSRGRRSSASAPA